MIPAPSSLLPTLEHSDLVKDTFLHQSIDANCASGTAADDCYGFDLAGLHLARDLIATSSFRGGDL